MYTVYDAAYIFILEWMRSNAKTVPVLLTGFPHRSDMGIGESLLFIV